jgi:hypothetical protein
MKKILSVSTYDNKFKKRDTIVGHEGLLKSIASKDKAKENNSKIYPKSS